MHTILIIYGSQTTTCPEHLLCACHCAQQGQKILKGQFLSHVSKCVPGACLGTAARQGGVSDQTLRTGDITLEDVIPEDMRKELPKSGLKGGVRLWGGECSDLNTVQGNVLSGQQSDLVSWLLCPGICFSSLGILEEE